MSNVQAEPYFETPLHKLSHFIGDYSQNVCGASYNEDQVREIWCKGTLNEEAKHPCYALDSAWPDAPKDFQAEMNRLVKEAGVWVSGWCSRPLPLTQQERKLIGVESPPADVLYRILQNPFIGTDGYKEQQLILIFYRYLSSEKDPEIDIEAIAQAVWNEFIIQMASQMESQQYPEVADIVGQWRGDMDQDTKSVLKHNPTNRSTGDLYPISTQETQSQKSPVEPAFKIVSASLTPEDQAKGFSWTIAAVPDWNKKPPECKG